MIVMRKWGKNNMCCLFGLVDYKNCFTARQKEKLIRVLSVECEERGTDATGVAYVEKGDIKICKKPLPAHKIKFKFKSNPKIIMGHTRMTTQGNEKFNYTNHTFYSERLNFALAHNGMIYNDRDLRKSENLPKTKIETDSFIAVQLIEQKGTLDFKTISNMAEKVLGSFCFTILGKNNEFYIVKGDNPMAVYDFGGFYIYASTNEILNKALIKIGIKAPYDEIKLSCGDMLKIDERGEIEKGSFDITNILLKEYQYLRGYGFGYRGYSFCDIGEESDFENEYYRDIVDYAKNVGFSEGDINSLLDMGYDFFDIEELLYEPDMMEYYLNILEKDKYLD